ncbi:MAG: glycosyltransferase [Ruminococcus flavefaciens]|nr:glycosyltransferase [Ruminococcus flavefaciens]
MQPKVSVLLPVYNGEQFLGEAIDSILNQTFQDYELLILLEYGSNEASRKIVEGRKTDKRIHVIENTESKLGLAESLNCGMREAKGEYIARMDADDISLPKRFEKQVKYLDSHPAIVMCGTAMKGLYDDGHMDDRGYFTDPGSIRFECMLGNPFGHPTVMWRRDVFLREKLFYRNTPYSEDFELWKRVVELFPCANLKEYLLVYRLHGASASVVYGDTLGRVNDALNKEYLAKHHIDYDVDGAFFRGGLSKEEIGHREEIVQQICRIWDDPRKSHKALEQRMRLFYMANGVYSFQRYWKTFSFVYQDSICDKFRIRIGVAAHKMIAKLRGSR